MQSTQKHYKMLFTLTFRFVFVFTTAFSFTTRCVSTKIAKNDKIRSWAGKKEIKKLPCIPIVCREVGK